MRSSLSGTHLRVSSSVDQITCFTPASRAASAIALACASSVVGEKWFQKKVTQYAPYAPSKARRRLSASSTFPATTSAPSAASARALSELTSRVIARATNGPSLSDVMARTNPPPCAPVAPTTAMIFLSDIDVPPRNAAGSLSADDADKCSSKICVPSAKSADQLPAADENSLRVAHSNGLITRTVGKVSTAGTSTE